MNLPYIKKDREFKILCLFRITKTAGDKLPPFYYLILHSALSKSQRFINLKNIARTHNDDGVAGLYFIFNAIEKIGGNPWNA